MKLLVTGGAGYIGSVVVERALSHGHRIVVLDNLQEGHAAAVAPECRLVVGDYGDAAVLDTAFQGESIDAVAAALGERAYLADRALATTLFLSLKLEKPLLLEGEAGVGKTELAKVTADALGARLIRLQCYEGIDVAHALYDWSYARQMLYIRTLEATGHARSEDEGHVLDEVFSRRFLERRPLLDAIDNDDAVPPVLLIDEIDRADDEFEAFLLELLSDFQATIPELGTIAARRRPVVFLTSNRTRELHEALKRRCLYMWVPYPSLEREIAIVKARIPEVPSRLATQAAAFVAEIRTLDLTKAPGIAETLDWTQALLALGQEELEADVVQHRVKRSRHRRSLPHLPHRARH